MKRFPCGSASGGSFDPPAAPDDDGGGVREPAATAVPGVASTSIAPSAAAGGPGAAAGASTSIDCPVSSRDAAISRLRWPTSRMSAAISCSSVSPMSCETCVIPAPVNAASCFERLSALSHSATEAAVVG